MRIALAHFTPREKAVAADLLELIRPVAREAVLNLYRTDLGFSDAQIGDALLAEELLKIEKMFRLEFDEDYMRCKRQIIVRANAHGMEPARYPLFFQNDFTLFTLPIVRRYRFRKGVEEALAVFYKVMLADVAYSMTYFTQVLEEERARDIAAIETAFHAEIAQRVDGLKGVVEVARHKAMTLSAAAAMAMEAVAGPGSDPAGVAAAVQDIAEATRSFSTTAHDIAQTTTQSARGVDAAADECSDLARHVTDLQASLGQIGGVVEEIRSLSAQTNLLALNATIEAARAGEAGRGFAVVAGEVKSLAQATDRSAGSIAARVGQIEASSDVILRSVEGLMATMLAMQSGARRVTEAVIGQASATEVIARQTDATVSGVSAMAQHSRLVNDLSRDAVQAARAMEAELERTGRISAELHGSLDRFVAEIAARRSTRAAAAPEPSARPGAA